VTMDRRKRVKKTQRGRRAANGLSKARLAAMIEEATVDAYDESEQATGWFAMFPLDVSILPNISHTCAYCSRQRRKSMSPGCHRL
jgi:hypothetical protein